MSKPMKGVIPAKTVQKPVVEKKETSEDNNGQTLKPIKKPGGTKTITIPKEEDSKRVVRVPSNDEIELMKEILVDKLMTVFVTRDEIKAVVEKTLQEMVASGAKVSDK